VACLFGHWPKRQKHISALIGALATGCVASGLYGKKPLLTIVNSEGHSFDNPADTPDGVSGPHIDTRPGWKIYHRKNPADGLTYLGAIGNVQSEKRL